MRAQEPVRIVREDARGLKSTFQSCARTREGFGARSGRPLARVRAQGHVQILGKGVWSALEARLKDGASGNCTGAPLGMIGLRSGENFAADKRTGAPQEASAVFRRGFGAGEFDQVAALQEAGEQVSFLAVRKLPRQKQKVVRQLLDSFLPDQRPQSRDVTFPFPSRHSRQRSPAADCAGRASLRFTA